jgi:hypothetical protein
MSEAEDSNSSAAGPGKMPIDGGERLLSKINWLLHRPRRMADASQTIL